MNTAWWLSLPWYILAFIAVGFVILIVAVHAFATWLMQDMLKRPSQAMAAGKEIAREYIEKGDRRVLTELGGTGTMLLETANGDREALTIPEDHEDRSTFESFKKGETLRFTLSDTPRYPKTGKEKHIVDPHVASAYFIVPVCND